MVVNWVGKNQPTGLESAPVLYPTLQRPQLARHKHARMLPSQAVEEFFRRLLRLSLQSLRHVGPVVCQIISTEMHQIPTLRHDCRVGKRRADLSRRE